MSKQHKGYMRIYLKTVGSTIPKIQYTEDWAKPKKRHKLLNKPRKYTLTCYIFNKEGDHVVESIDSEDKISHDTLSLMIVQESNRIMRSYPKQRFNLVDSYVNIRVNYKD